MLIELSVRNLAIFSDVRVPFAPGLNIVTGETGAGKSILVEAIRLALGEKADPMAVKAGEAEAEVSARFDLSGRADLKETWEEAGFPWEEELVLRRVIPAAGRSRAYFNGRMASQSVLADLSPLLVELVGQHSVTHLLSRAAALSAVDGFSGTAMEASEMRRLYRRISALRRNVEEAGARGANARERGEHLDFQVQELARAALDPAEEERLAADLLVFRNASKMLSALRGAEDALSSSEHSSVSALSFAAARLKEAAAVDPRLAGLVERVRSLQIEAQELARELSGLSAAVDLSAESMERAEERLSEIRRLKRKYGTDVPGLLAMLSELRGERERLEGALEEERRLRELLRKEEDEAVRAATELGRKRREGAKRMGSAVEKELSRVALAGAKFRVELASRPPGPESLSAHGFDEAEFLLCANPGQELRPLSATASGGELSRVMLALRNTSARERGNRTMVFDEIDTGIGGKVAERVGARLKGLGATAQVICVTHLPQVAAFADTHLLVAKKSGKSSVATGVQALSKQDRIKELARMISGAEVTEEAQAHARELIEGAARG
ncbi:MAG: repair protein RecN, DNA repair protein RecN (Recombination protein N) protein [Deltaproteobacteria bacterium CSP1-8]|nr:MAG: repair protein RecN, DNA repair protein RecN (Recombination protein N) protein [Deltaproteobacteria bacterium CSP1-8]